MEYGVKGMGQWIMEIESERKREGGREGPER
jgi:hypothetical protein